MTFSMVATPVELLEQLIMRGLKQAEHLAHRHSEEIKQSRSW
jgi:hypothetical protein